MMQLNDPSSSSIIPIEQPVPVESIRYMDSDLIKAAEDGEMEPFNQYQGDLHCLVDKRRNTALHIYSKTGGREVVETDESSPCSPRERTEREFSINFVEQLVDKCPSLLLQPNDSGEIPLHIAVRYGHSKIVEFLIERAKVVQHEDVEKGKSSEAASSTLRQMLSMKDEGGDTAFHEAARSENVDVVRLLVKELDVDFSFSADKNKKGKTPLYIAAKRSGNHLVVGEILDHCKSIDYGGPRGKTALHAAVKVYQNEMTVRKLVEAKKQLTKETDDKGWTPLHHAVTLYGNCAAKLLLEADASAAYRTDKERGMSPLHIAAWRGDTEMMECIISHCSGCCEIVDNRGWNFFHIIAAAFLPKEIMRFLPGYENIIKDLPFKNLLNKKDNNGMTPFHVLKFGPVCTKYENFQEVYDFFCSHQSKQSWTLRSTIKAKKKQIREVVEDMRNCGIIGHYLLRRLEEEEEAAEKDVAEREIKEKARENHLLVATLVATVTFAAAFTVPGGYKSEQGTAILSGDSAFKAFVITDTLAFVFSLLAIFLHFIYVLLNKYERGYHVRWVHLADWLTFSAMVAMVVAFSTGSYAVLKSSLGFAITNCFLGIIFFPSLLVVVFLSYFCACA